MADQTGPHAELTGLTIARLQERLASGETTSLDLCRRYVERIVALDRSGPALHSVLETAPDLEEQARRCDRARAGGRAVGLLHGIPLLLKDNLDTAGAMWTTAGSLALCGVPAPADAPAVARLRDAGAIVIGKTNLSEWANWRGSQSISGWSGRGGQTRNPHVLDRTPSGSSSGSGVAAAAALAAAAVGTETDGSIVSPANANGVVGMKPTVGLVPQEGIVPISSSQDAAGPLARSVADAALLLAVLAGQPALAGAADPDRLRGARIGVLREGYLGKNAYSDRLFEEALESLRAGGAELVDPVTIATLDELQRANLERVIFAYEMKAALQAYLARRTGLDVHTVADVIAFNLAHADRELGWFGQENLEESAAAGPLTDERYLEARARGHRLSREEGIDRALGEHRLDALVAPTGTPAAHIDPMLSERRSGPPTSFLPALAGYPIVSVPMGFARDLLPVGLAFFAGAGSEATLLGLAAGFERVAPHYRAPRYVPSVPLP